MMTLKELKTFLNNLPDDFDEYGIVNGEVGVLDGTGESGEEQTVYRCDKPIITLYVDEGEKEVCFFHQTQDDVNDIYNPNLTDKEEDSGDTEEDKG